MMTLSFDDSFKVSNRPCDRSIFKRKIDGVRLEYTWSTFNAGVSHLKRSMHQIPMQNKSFEAYLFCSEYFCLACFSNVY